VVQELLGHSDIGTTARYLHTTESDLRFTIHNMPIFDVARHKDSIKQAKLDYREFYADGPGER